MRKKIRFWILLLALFYTVIGRAEVPFVATTITNDGAFATDTRWYTLKIAASGYIISDNGSNDYIDLSRTKTDFADMDLWCFVGNETDGYKIYNKQAGAGKVLVSPTSMGGDEGGNAYVVLKDAVGLGADYSTAWDFVSVSEDSDGDPLSVENGWCINQHAKSANIMNNREGKLAFWTGGYDSGSAVVVEFAKTTIPVSEASGLFTASNAGKTWHSKWESTATNPHFSFSCPNNNMQYVSGDIAAYVGSVASSCVYSLSASAGYAVSGFSFDFVNAATGYELTLSCGDKTYKTSMTSQNLTVNDLKEQVATFTLSGANKGVLLQHFYVTITRSQVVPEPSFEVFPTPTSSVIPYRIPAIAKAHNGDIVAVADYRFSRADIGSGRLDLHGRISKDNGKTWGDIFTIIAGDGVMTKGNFNAGFGDPCIVADSESDRVLMMSCAGAIMFPNGTRDNHQGIARFYSDDNGATWSAPEDIAESIYSQFDNSKIGPARSMFIGSGRIFQSSTVKVDQYYRLYCSVLLKDKNSNNCNFVLYSDDFGGTWKVLGGVDLSPIPSGGDEPKTEELPDGSVIVSSRCTGGRYYNIFSFTNSEKAEGAWGAMAFSGASNNGVTALSNSCNGEVMVVPAIRKSDNKDVYLLLQSLPFGAGRSNVGIYYKELAGIADFSTPENMAKDWDGRHQATKVGSAYSTMILQGDNNIGFLYEDDTYGVNGGGGYTIMYKNYSIETITDSLYSYKSDVNPMNIVSNGIEDKVHALFENADKKYVGMYDISQKESVDKALDTYKQEKTKVAYEALNKAIVTLPTIQIEEGKWYRIRNSERLNGTLFLVPGTLSGEKTFTAATKVNDNADQLFTFKKADDGWKIYNGNHDVYIGKTGAVEARTPSVNDIASASNYSVRSSSAGLSAFVCNNATNTTYPALHLAGDNTRIVPWSASGSPASLWYIEPVDSIEITVPEGGFTTINLPFNIETGANVEVYTALLANPEGDYKLYLERVNDVLPATIPAVLKAPAETYYFAITDKLPVKEISENGLKGVLTSKNISGSNIFLLDLTGAEPVFGKRKTSSGSVVANKAYVISETTGDKIPFVFGIPTTIKDVENTQKVIPCYDLSGRRVVKPSKGIYVTEDGRKILNK